MGPGGGSGSQKHGGVGDGELGMTVTHVPNTSGKEHGCWQPHFPDRWHLTPSLPAGSFVSPASLHLCTNGTPHSISPATKSVPLP